MNIYRLILKFKIGTMFQLRVSMINFVLVLGTKIENNTSFYFRNIIIKIIYDVIIYHYRYEHKYNIAVCVVQHSYIGH